MMSLLMMHVIKKPVLLIVLLVIGTATQTGDAFSPRLATAYPNRHDHHGQDGSSGNYARYQHHGAVPPTSSNSDEPSSVVASDEQEDLGDDLTSKLLTLRLFEAREYYRQHPGENMSQGEVCRLLLRTRLPNLRLNRCHTAPSSIAGAGTGVFASRDIDQGELITLYPGDALLIANATATNDDDDNDNDDDDNKFAPVGVIFGNHVTGADRDMGRVTAHEARSYEMEINDFVSIIADPQIGVEDAAYLAHFVNDGASLYNFDTASREAYSKNSIGRCNAAAFVMEQAHMASVATKKIKKGEEIFHSYGEGYWLTRSASPTEKEKIDAIVEMAEAKQPLANELISTSSRQDDASTDSGKRKLKKKKNSNNKPNKPKLKGANRGFGTKK